MTINVRNNVLDFAYNNLICRNISESSHLESLNVKPKYLASLVNLSASSPIIRVILVITELLQLVVF